MIFGSNIVTESYWPKEGYLERCKYSVDDRKIIEVNERLRRMEVTISDFGEVREHLEFLDKKIKKLEAKK